MSEQKINVTVLGWGKGSYSMLSAIRDNDDYNISSIISMSDSGWSTGVLREEFDILPPGDVRRAVIALSREHDLVKQLFEYRYDKASSVNGHVIGNLLITAMSHISGNFEKWLKQICKLFKVKWRVIPVTLEKSDLEVELEDGTKVFSETNIDEANYDTSQRIVQARLIPEVDANPRAIKALKKSDLIILTFGDIYTSLIPNLLANGVVEAICESDAKVVYFTNLMTKKWESTKTDHAHFEVIDFVEVIEQYLWKCMLDYVVVNNGYISDELTERYKKFEHKSPVKVKDSHIFHDKNYQVLERDLLHDTDNVRHSYDKVGRVVSEIVSRIEMDAEKK